MNRQEDFKQKATEYNNNVNMHLDFYNGAEYGYQYAVDKACEFLEKYAANFVALPDEGQQPIGDTNAIYGTKSLLYYLRKEMEEL